jgi:hypothetical protein
MPMNKRKNTWNGTELYRAAAMSPSWAEALRRYNQATGEDRTLVGIMSAASERGFKLAAARHYDMDLVRRMLQDSPESWQQIADRYDAAKGKAPGTTNPKRLAQAANAIGLGLSRESCRRERCEGLDIQARALALKQYKAAKGIAGRTATDAECEKAFAMLEQAS